MTDNAPVPAATLVILRDREGGAPELLMVERSRAMVFAGGAMVFPGGRIDPGDATLAARIAPGEEDAAAKIAAIRETIEEVGLPIGVQGLVDVAALRAALHAGVAFGEALEAAGATLDLDALVPFARWLPGHKGTRIFDTRFFLARAREGDRASVDRTENVRLTWMGAADLIAAADRGEARVIFPTRRNLERLARFDSYGAAVADAAAHPVRTITPFVEEREGTRWLCIPEGLGYPVTAEPFDTASRG
jgi:8-oxo-dGTP pyrophosphatase MutT (NUDIX family)